MGLKEFIPGTEARRDRLFKTILAKDVGDKDGLALIEWEDQSVTTAAVEWDSDNSAIVDDEGNRFFARGLGSSPKTFCGVPIWFIYAGNAGIMSTEACLIADAEAYEDRVYDVGAGEELPDDLVAEGVIDPNSGRGPGDTWELEQVDRGTIETARAIARGDLKAVTKEDLDRLRAEANADDEESGLISGAWSPDIFGSDDSDETDDQDALTDGGAATESVDPLASPGQTQSINTTSSVIEDGQPTPDGDSAVYDLRPPDGYDGVAIDPRQPDEFDPNPVTRADAKGAVEWARHAETDGNDTWMYGFLVGVGVTLFVVIVMYVLPWLLGQIGGGGGGGSQVSGLLPFLAIPIPAFREYVNRLGEVI